MKPIDPWFVYRPGSYTLDGFPIPHELEGAIDLRLYWPTWRLINEKMRKITGAIR